MNTRTSANELICHLHNLEEFEATSLAGKVIEKAIEAGFLTLGDSPDNRSRLAWIEKVTRHAEDAFKLEEVAEGEPLELTIDNFKQLVERRDKQVSDVLELLAKYVVDAAPSYSSR
ncbi:hypothetical protein ACED66_22980 [Vibrio splendidus]|uniref:hypothetical protein n=1 Tax=Vibrio splendidus TaxID=29497 RepID=UPI000D37A4CF|nr:hypothetical protein [Vibrio splendidus]PTP95725.1 hypothetical protein CWO28_23255 [Vibrio splendidus]